MTFRHLVIAALFGFTLASCKKENPDPVPTPAPEPRLIFKFKFDSTQERLNNIGQPDTVQAGHGAQSPKFNAMSAHYIELAPGALTPLGDGTVLYKAMETNIGGATAILFDSSKLAAHNETFFSIPLDSVGTGSYEWLRVSLAYQNYDIRFKSSLIPGDGMGSGTVASFIGYNTYIGSFKPKNETITVNENKAQGYWAFETFGQTVQGQAPPGATTVPNPLFSTSPVPAGSCVVTGAFDQPLVITGNETEDIIITVSVSTNNSFEWSDTADDNVYQPEDGEVPVDMGVRGMKPIVQQ